MFKNQKGVSLISLVITMIVIILIAMITFLASRDQIERAHQTAFYSELEELNTGLQTYIERSYVFGVSTFNSDELWWDGIMDHMPENTAKQTNHVDEDEIKVIFGKNEIPANVRDKIYINGGKLYVYKDKNPEFEWVCESEKFKYMANSEFASTDFNN